MQVFDGHSGKTAARYAEQHLLANLLREDSFLTAPAEALVCFLYLLIAQAFHGTLHAFPLDSSGRSQLWKHASAPSRNP